MLRRAKVIKQIDDKTYEVNIAGIGVKRAVEINAVGDVNYAQNDTVVVDTINDVFYVIMGILPTQISDTSGEMSSKFKGLPSVVKGLKPFMRTPGDVYIGSTSSANSSTIAALASGAFLNYAGPNCFICGTRDGDLTLSGLYHDIFMSGYRQTSRIVDILYNHTVWTYVLGSLAQPENKAYENITGYIGDQPSVGKKTVPKTTGSWTKIGNYVVEFDNTNDSLSVDLVKATTTEATRYGLEVTSSGIKLYWGNTQTKYIEISDNGIVLKNNLSSISLTEFDVVVEAPTNVNLKVSESAFLVLNNNTTILGTSSAILPSNIELSATPLTYTGSTASAASNIVLTYTAGTGINVKAALTVKGKYLMNSGFYLEAWKPAIQLLQQHIHPVAVGGGTSFSSPAPFEIYGNIPETEIQSL